MSRFFVALRDWLLGPWRKIWKWLKGSNYQPVEGVDPHPWEIKRTAGDWLGPTSDGIAPPPTLADTFPFDVFCGAMLGGIGVFFGIALTQENWHWLYKPLWWFGGLSTLFVLVEWYRRHSKSPEKARHRSWVTFGAVFGAFVIAFIIVAAVFAHSRPQSLAPYPAALLNCYEDARIFQNRTLFQPSLPREIVYMTEDGSQQISKNQAQVNESPNAIYQVSGEFFQCNLTNEGDSDLTEVALTFQNFYVNGWKLKSGEPFWFSISRDDHWIPVRAYTVSLLAKHAFEFALVNFGSRWSTFGIPKDLRNGSPPLPPDLAYRIGSEGKIEGARPLTLTRDARAISRSPFRPLRRRLRHGT